MVAFPLCFPEVTVPPPADECHITAVDVTPPGVVYMGLSGRRARVMVGMFHACAGAVMEGIAPADATECPAVCCGKTHFAAFFNSPAGGSVAVERLWASYKDTIQEWVLMPWPSQDLGVVFAGERVLHAVADRAGRCAVGVTDRRLFRLELKTSELSTIAELNGAGRLVVGSRGGVFGPDEGQTLWRYDTRTSEWARRAVKLPAGDWSRPLNWARSPLRGRNYLADAGGRLFAFDEKTGFSDPLGNTPHTAVGPMAVTFDGRVFGFSGEGIAKLFCFDPRKKIVTELGAAVSTIQRRRYGYVFGDAVTGRDGQILFGEDDDLGHIWLYFPRIRNH